MATKGQEIKVGLIPSLIYTVRFEGVEDTISKNNLRMVKINCEILGPEVVEHAGSQYKTLGTRGTMYVMLDNKNGPDDAIGRLVEPLRKLGIYDELPDTYGANDIAAALENLQGCKIQMLVTSQVEYQTTSTDPKDRGDARKAIVDPETNEPIVRRYIPQFSFDNVRKMATSEFDSGNRPF